MNVYSKFFAGKLGFRDEEAARESVGLIDTLYRQFGLAGDRAGQHHALLDGADDVRPGALDRQGARGRRIPPLAARTAGRTDARRVKPR